MGSIQKQILGKCDYFPPYYEFESRALHANRLISLHCSTILPTRGHIYGKLHFRIIID